MRMFYTSPLRFVVEHTLLEVDFARVQSHKHVQLANTLGITFAMFFSQGKGEFSMEYCKYEPVLPQLQADLIKQYQTELQSKTKT